MKFYPTLLVPALVVATSTLAISAHAQDIDLSEIVVTPNRTPTEKAKVGSTVNTVDREQIEQQSLPLVVDYLNQIPGVAVTSPGGPGTEASLSIRGAPRRYVKTLYNGIDISDPTNTQVQTSYQYLLAGGVSNIEVLKGAQSTLYGSDAIAGVISIDTLGDIDPGISHIIEGEGGSLGTARGHYGLRAADEKGKFGLNVTGFRTDGISAAASGSERDGFEDVMLDANGEYSVNEDFSVFGSAFYINAKADFDNDGYIDFATGDFVPPSDNLTATNTSEQIAGRAGFNLDLMDGRFRNTVSIQAFDIARTIDGTTFDGTYDGRRYKADYQGAFDINDWLTLQGGTDYEMQRAVFPEGVFNPEIHADFWNAGLWTEGIAEPLENLTLTAGIRHDMHSVYGSHTTFRGTASYGIGQTGTRLHASVGTGFRAPSLNELYGPFGANPGLRPETSIGFDVGIEQAFLDNRLITDVTYFRSEIDDLITYTTGYVQLPGTSKQEGVEATLTYAVNGWLNVGGSYTYTESRDQNDNRLTRVPRHAIGIIASAEPWEHWTLSGAAKIALDTIDTGDFRLDDYVLVNAKIAYKPTENTELYLRAENALDQDYQTARGFNTPGFSVFAGFRAKIGG